MRLVEIHQLDEMHPMTKMMMNAMGDKNPEKTEAHLKKEAKVKKDKKRAGKK